MTKTAVVTAGAALAVGGAAAAAGLIVAGGATGLVLVGIAYPVKTAVKYAKQHQTETELDRKLAEFEAKRLREWNEYLASKDTQTSQRQGYDYFDPTSSGSEVNAEDTSNNVSVCE